MPKTIRYDDHRDWFEPKVNDTSVRRNPEHYPTQVQQALNLGYGGRSAREDAEKQRQGQQMPGKFAAALATDWCAFIDNHESTYFTMPRGSFRDSSLDRSAKDLPPPTPKAKGSNGNGPPENA